MVGDADIESVGAGGSVAVVEPVPGCSLAIAGSVETIPFVDCEQPETSHIIVLTTVNPHPTIRFLHLAISFPTFKCSLSTVEINKSKKASTLGQIIVNLSLNNHKIGS
jgi:hypothetical protein